MHQKQQNDNHQQYLKQLADRQMQDRLFADFPEVDPCIIKILERLKIGEGNRNDVVFILEHITQLEEKLEYVNSKAWRADACWKKDFTPLNDSYWKKVDDLFPV